MKRLGPGSRIGVIAPSGPFDLEAFEVGIARLRERYDVVFDDSIREKHGFLAGTDERRAHELRQALRDPSIDAVCCARGGYGATRLLPELSVDEIRRASKPLVGFSDVTALHALWAQAGVPSMHGFMVAALGRARAERIREWQRVLEGERTLEFEGLEVLRSGTAEGVLVGGNLSVLAALCGTPFAPPLEGTLLVLEDVGEKPYRVDRMLTTLGQNGWFERVRAVVVGAFSECEPQTDAVTVEQVLRERLQRVRTPVLMGLPIGHLETSIDLPLGVRALIGPHGLFSVAPLTEAR